jgi:hypothetical protein
MSVPTCPIRKPCAFCGESFGRRLRTNNRTEKLYLVTMDKFDATDCCSAICATKLRAKHRNAKRLILEQAERDSRNLVNSFLYGVGK